MSVETSYNLIKPTRLLIEGKSWVEFEKTDVIDNIIHRDTKTLPLVGSSLFLSKHQEQWPRSS